MDSTFKRSPYPEIEVQFIPVVPRGTMTAGYALCKKQTSGPLLYFVIDIKLKREYWSAVESMAKTWGHYFLALDYLRFLDSKPDAQPGEPIIVSRSYREMYESKPTTGTTPAVQTPSSDVKWWKPDASFRKAEPPQVSLYRPKRSAQIELIDKKGW